ncbi:hypothetical protein BDV95DRAFT_596877 [Massariosphaeria phaeospora]|uniref:Cytochrome P450 n=1 Tax=Massariosphaeria phaeospora TaxID=100035 RepID=A0A7C8IBT5_9PLEO|nr:hypothetical protein BDV95DRAFT_596877 [Massariosphaeria phaeospora]
MAKEFSSRPSDWIPGVSFTVSCSKLHSVDAFSDRPVAYILTIYGGWFFNPSWRLTSNCFLNLGHTLGFRKAPVPLFVWRANTSRLLQIWKLWDVGHKPFEKVGSDNVMFATPSATMFYTCDPVVVKQLYSSPKVQAAIENLQFLNIWGPNISTVEGDEWKYHRKIITSALNPSMNEMVWRETIQEAEGLIAHWFRGNNPGYIANVKSSTSCLVLHVLSSVFFDRKLDWKEEEKVDETDFETALFTVIERAGLIFMVPRKILKLPIKGLRKA